MGNSVSGLDCTARGDNFAPNGDIVGIGVLVAFFATAATTIGAIIYGYLSESFAESYYNELDQFVIKVFRESRIYKAISWWSGVWHSLIDGLKSRLKLEVANRPQNLSREARKEALCRFILTLSDQQLVTGLAILIGAVVNQRTLSVYEFNVVLSLAWFSSTTHLATLDALREYFQEHSIVRNWRVCGMLSLLILLTYTLLMATFVLEMDPTVPVRCYFSTPTRTPVFLAVAESVVTLILIYSGYIARVQGLYSESHKPETLMSLGGRLSWILSRSSSSKSQTQSNFFDITAEVDSTVRFGYLRRLELISQKSKSKSKLLSSSYQYDDSFISSMSGIAFSFSYGMAQVIYFRWIYGRGLNRQASAIDFGQITPLFLLVLPVLAAAEIYYESRDKEKKLASECEFSAEMKPESLSPVTSNECINTYSSSTDNAYSYQQKLPAMRKFLYREIEEVLKKETAATTPEDYSHVLQHKTRVLSDFEHIEAFEKSLDRTPSIYKLALGTTVSIVLGIILNIPKDIYVVAFASAVYLAWFLDFVYVLVFRLYPYIEKRKETILNQAADLEFYSQQGKGSAIHSEHKIDDSVMPSGNQSSSSESSASTLLRYPS